MKLLICGSGAAEGVPSLFCDCALCRRALSVGGKEMRSRTAYQLGEEIRIDCGPDLLHQMYQFKLHLEKWRWLLFTHSHRDHCYPQDLQNRRRGFAQMPEGEALRIAATPELLESLGAQVDFERDRIVGVPIGHGSELDLGAGIQVTALRANHHNCLGDPLIFAFRTPGKNLLIGHDSGIFPEESWAELKKFRFDVAIIDCTSQACDQRDGHLGGAGFFEAVARLREQGSLAPDALVAANHFSHNAGLSHTELLDYFTPRGVAVGFDGMAIEL